MFARVAVFLLDALDLFLELVLVAFHCGSAVQGPASLVRLVGLALALALLNPPLHRHVDQLVHVIQEGGFEPEVKGRHYRLVL